MHYLRFNPSIRILIGDREIAGRASCKVLKTPHQAFTYTSPYHTHLSHSRAAKLATKASAVARVRILPYAP